ncbi:FtsK/SpoIIIE domain-containing protein [Humidisolicoccus flavus]|uniref:FtsK/SpoIIIE domain-containing protein n=1 Tax=Humidisolicoccus flavus TaxID=3111414 RepID=UPI0032479279
MPHTNALELPQPPTDPARGSFPLLASVAPVFGALALWAITSSPTVLIFAALGPVIAIAGLGDGAISRRRHRVHEQRRVASQFTSLEQEVTRLHALEREQLLTRYPDARALLHRPDNDPSRWQSEAPGTVPVRVGLGVARSALRVQPYAHTVDRVTRDLGDALVQQATRLSGQPVVLDAAQGIGIVAPVQIGAAILRAVLLSVLGTLSPASVRVIVEGPREWRWTEALPHHVEFQESPTTHVRVLGDTIGFTLALASDAAMLPRDCRAVIAGGFTEVAVHGAEVAEVTEVIAEALSLRESIDGVQQLHAAAVAAGFSHGAQRLPGAVALSEIRQERSAGLGARFLVSTDGAATIDLVHDGPHAVVGGTTGSGKSELLISWIAALAATATPKELAILLVDFKGGASFGPLTGLQHCVGVITDLDAHAARRAIESLRAELRARERALAELGARSLEECGGKLPRLVIVVDEFAAMLQEFPELHELFTDLAARGRSLGIHLILCTQRPAVALRDAVLANTGIRISLRVTEAADAVALTGVPAAAHFTLEHRGRCVVAIAGRDVYEAQTALSDQALLDETMARSRLHDAPRRPWRQPLPSSIDDGAAELLCATSAGTTPRRARQNSSNPIVAIIDRPADQALVAWRWNEIRDGNLAVVGARTSGKTWLTHRLAALPNAVLVNETAALWDALATPIQPGVLLIDDFDLLVQQAGDEYGMHLVQRLAHRMRAGGPLGHSIVMTVRRSSNIVAPVLALAENLVVLRSASKHEHVMLGVQSAVFDPAVPAGGGWLRDERVQLLVPSRTAPSASPAKAQFAEAGAVAHDCLVIHGEFSSELHSKYLPELRSAHLSEGGDREDIMVRGSVSEWLGQWAMFTRWSAARPLVFLGCTPKEVRQLLPSAALPPLMVGEAAWLFRQGRFVRLSPHAPAASAASTDSAGSE